jgi:carbon storage regulator
MLVLARKVGEGVVVGSSIRVKVLEVSAGTVRLGFEAPADVSIYREEIYLEISQAQQPATELAEPDEDEDEES